MPDRLRSFLPYLLNQAAEAASQEFQAYYKARYGMLRTEWRVLFHVAIEGRMTATQIREQAVLHKTKVSRAVRALEAKRMIARESDSADRRMEWLSLTPKGEAVFADLRREAEAFEARLLADWTPEEAADLKASLMRLAPNLRDNPSRP